MGCSLESAKGTARTAERVRNCFAPRSVLRGFLKSAKGAARTAGPDGELIATRSVLRGFLKSAKGAARTAGPDGELIAPRSVLRGFLKGGVAAELAIGYTARTLDPTAEAEFARHLESCGSCRELVARQAAVWAALEEWRPLPVSSDFDAKLFARIAQGQRGSRWTWLFRPGWSWRPALPVAAACAVLVAAFLLKDPDHGAAPSARNQAKPRIEQQVERALDDMDLLGQIGVDAAVEGSNSSEKI